MKYSQIREHIEQQIVSVAQTTGLPLNVYSHKDTINLQSIQLPALAVVINGSRNQDRPGRVSISKVLSVKIIIIENDGKYDNLYLDFIESLFQKDYCMINIPLANVINNDLRYTGFETRFRDEGEKLITFCTVNFELNLEESLN